MAKAERERDQLQAKRRGKQFTMSTENERRALTIRAVVVAVAATGSIVHVA